MTTPGRAELAELLDLLVKASGLRPAEVARRAGVTEATVSRWLHNKVTPSSASVTKLVVAMGVDHDPAARQAVDLAEDLRAGQAHRVVILRPGTATLQRRFDEIEAGTEHVAAYAPTVVPGLLQVEPYARVVLGSTGRSGELLDKQVRDRMKRQRILDDPAHRVTLVMSEGALRWQVVSPDVMLVQLVRLAGLARRDTDGRVSIGVIPTSVAVDYFPMTGFDLYDNAKVCIGAGFGTAFLDRPRDVAGYVDMFSRVQASAVFGEAAASEFDRIGDEYRSLMA